MEDKQDIPSLEEVRRRLFHLRKIPGHADWVYNVGRFTVSIVEYWEDRDMHFESLLDCKTVDISLLEGSKRGGRTFISLREDHRFNTYRPIMYDFFDGPNGIVNCSDGHKMPIHHLCELIRYLHRLNKLTAFQ